MDKRVRWGIIIFLVLGLTGWGLYRFLPTGKSNEEKSTAAQPQQGNSRRILNVNAVTIKEHTLADDINPRGRLMPDEEVDLSFQTSGQVTQINFSEGHQVQKGQLLAKVNDAPLQAQLKKLEAQLKLAQDRVYRQSALLEKDAVSKEAYEQVKTDLEALNADIQLVKANIALTELRAPFDGVISLRQVSEGAYASPTTVIAKLTKVSPLKVEFSIPERYSNQITVGTKVSFTVDGILDTFYASVYAMASQIDPITNTLTVRALYPNTNNRLLPGKPANIWVRMFELSDAISIPSQAIVPEMGKDKVFLYKNGKAEPVFITKGLRTASDVQVLEGLNVGDTLIVSGTLQLRTGLPVTLDNID
ncbi:efflux RND transporter periplasmic adaptor subunit [Bacteroides sp. 51]|uniref:efflux RND transporter periplasmic adaptor subunit n=1 Tax=Bacteroides sp. 51 TaxID=2302938 RepID=UPI0013CFF137|nr:efflux RND transporter periplasmic adaptor subunit [Bacteroides sp. 51]NDV83033.1 efflux RND transporter periplasmic adaptor subunit [Bacteroides sp. 51]